MIKEIVEMLKIDNFYGVSERIDIAKGKYKAPLTFSESKDIIKRNWYGKE